MRATTPRTKIFALVLASVSVCAVVSVAAWSIAQTPKLSSRDEQQVWQRAQAWYTALANGKFDDAYSFFGTAMRRDIERDQYIANAKMVIARLSVVAGPDVTVSTTGTAHRPLGTAKSRIVVVAKTEKETAIPLSHTTFWIQEPSERGTMVWVLAGDEMQDSRFSATPAVSPFISLTAPKGER